MNSAVSFSYSLCLVPPPPHNCKKYAWRLRWVPLQFFSPLEPAGSSSKAWMRAYILTFFRSLVSLTSTEWTWSLRPLLLVGLAIFVFGVKGPEALLVFVYFFMFFFSLLVLPWVGSLRLILLYEIQRGCVWFSYFYTFDTVLLSSYLRSILLKNIPRIFFLLTNRWNRSWDTIPL